MVTRLDVTKAAQFTIHAVHEEGEATDHAKLLYGLWESLTGLEGEELADWLITSAMGDEKAAIRPF